MPISPSGTAPTIPARTPSVASATAQRAPSMLRNRSNARGSADQRTTERNSKTRPRSERRVRLAPAPGFVYVGLFFGGWRMHRSLATLSWTDLFRDGSDEAGESRTPRARPLRAGRSGQGRSRESPREEEEGEPCVVRVHATTVQHAFPRRKARRPPGVAEYAVIRLARRFTAS